MHHFFRDDGQRSWLHNNVYDEIHQIDSKRCVLACVWYTVDCPLLNQRLNSDITNTERCLDDAKLIKRVSHHQL